MHGIRAAVASHAVLVDCRSQAFVHTRIVGRLARFGPPYYFAIEVVTILLDLRCRKGVYIASVPLYARAQSIFHTY